jgi:Mg-chelatase subunit ChlD
MTTDLNQYFDNLLARHPRQQAVHQQPAFRMPSARPQCVVFCLDKSGSMAEKDIHPDRLEAAIRATEAYSAARWQMGAPDLVAAVVFDDSGAIISGLVPIQDATRRIIAPLRRVDARGGTDISAGLVDAETCLAVAPPAHDRVLVVLSDGHGGEPYRVAHRIKRSGTIINCIGVGRAPCDVDEECLKRVCSKVDGVLRYQFITNARDLTAHFESLATGLSRVQ